MEAIERATAFFYDHAGFSWNPEHETMEQGKNRCALILAVSERDARELGYSFEWRIDQNTDSSDFSDDPEPWRLWECYMHSPDGEICGSLHGIDFGRDKEPWGDPYRRVVEAELASEYIDTSENA